MRVLQVINQSTKETANPMLARLALCRSLAFAAATFVLHSEHDDAETINTTKHTIY